MRVFVALASLLILSGCSQLKSAATFLPKEHDTALAGKFVETKIQINNLSCENKNTDSWNDAANLSLFVKEYAAFRDDPQYEAAEAVHGNILKADNTESVSVCKHWLKLTSVRLQALEIAWKGR